MAPGHALRNNNATAKLTITISFITAAHQANHTAIVVNGNLLITPEPLPFDPDFGANHPTPWLQLNGATSYLKSGHRLNAGPAGEIGNVDIVVTPVHILLILTAGEPTGYGKGERGVKITLAINKDQT